MTAARPKPKMTRAKAGGNAVPIDVAKVDSAATESDDAKEDEYKPPSPTKGGFKLMGIGTMKALKKTSVDATVAMPTEQSAPPAK